MLFLKSIKIQYDNIFKTLYCNSFTFPNVLELTNCQPLPENLKQLKKRNLGKKRSMALREFALGVESLERFVKNEPLRRVHECVFGVLALESEGVDPRL